MLKYHKFFDTRELLNLYSIYYACPSIVNWEALFNAILHYRFDDYPLFVRKSGELQTKTVITDVVTLTSNNKITYLVGPNAYRVLHDIESYLRFKHFSTKTKVLFVEDEIKGLKIARYLTGTEHFKVLCLPNLREHQSLIRPYLHDHVVMGHARSLNQLSELQIPVINTDGAAFIKTKQYVNDQMIDWRSGLNFWTCCKGHKHFLPIFSNYKNLLNMCDSPKQESDWLQPMSEFFKCRCGLMRCNFDFVPHYKRFIDNQKYDDLLKLANKLNGNYRWIQFVQKFGVIHVYHDGAMVDMEIIQDQFKMPVHLESNEFFMVGCKLPTFWKVS